MGAGDQLDFIQVSDCHIGRILANHLYPMLVSTAIGGGVSQPAHDIDLCKALGLALEDVRTFAEIPAHVAVPVVMSGDLTASGDATEFPVAHSFFRSNWRLSRADVSRFEQEAGLNLDSADFVGVPGNHDNWLGRGFRASPARNPHLFPKHFRPTPWTRSWVGRSGRLRLHLCGLDSNSGVSGKSSRRARGAFDTEQLKCLEVPPEQPSGGDGPLVTVKAVVSHHSLAYTAGLFAFGSLELEVASREALLHAMAKNGYVAVMTGHTHDPLQAPFDVSIDEEVCKVYELRCPSTLQGPPEDGKQGFLLHRIHSNESGGYQWSTWKYAWAEGSFIREDDGSRWPSFSIA